jgi:hypothetical protein
VIARVGLDGIEAGALEVLADQTTVDFKANLSADPSAIYTELGGRP